MPTFVTCEICNRILYEEHGPVCVFCRDEDDESEHIKVADALDHDDDDYDEYTRYDEDARQARIDAGLDPDDDE